MKRHWTITMICIAGYLSVVFTFPQVFSPSVKKLGMFVPALYGILVSAHFIACVGLWHLKRWGAELYLLAFFGRTLFFILTEQTGFGFYLGLLISVIFSFLLLRHYPRLSANL